MNRAEKRRIEKLAAKTAKASKSIQPDTTVSSEQQRMLYIQQMINLGIQHHSAGDLPKAESIYKQVLQFEPNQPDALNYLGVIAHQVGKYEVAIELIDKALSIKPNSAEAYTHRGLALKGLGKLDDAVASYHKALAIKPDYTDAHNNLGTALKEQGKLDDAVASYNKVLAIKPDNAEAHNNLGAVLQAQGKLSDAVASYHKALAIKLNYIEAHYNLGTVLKEQGKLDDAVASYRKALAIKPDYIEAHNNLGSVLKEQGKLDDAVACYNKVLAIKPDNAEAHNNLGAVFQAQGKQGDAVASYHKAITIKPDMDGWHIRKALTLPVILSSIEDIHLRRSKLVVLVQELRNRSLSVDDPSVDIGVTNFKLAYHSQDDKDLLESIAHLHLSACPKLAYEAKHCRREYSRRKGSIRIGFLSSFFRDHTIGKLYRGIIEHFSKDQFEIIVFQPAKKKDEISEAIHNTADKVVLLHKKLEQDWARIAAEELDILFYPDIGMDPYAYFLAFARLAPVQIVSWGHPDTTGIPNIDYFLSSDLIEPEGSSRHYTEQLAQLSLMPTFYYQPEPPDKTYKRTDFDLPETGAMYVCPQTLFKLHPDFDTVLAELLIKDPEGYLVLINDNVGGHLKKLVEERFQASFPDVSDRVIFVPHMDKYKFMGLTMLADAMLDVPSFSGGNSSLEAFAMSVPIVTWPGEFMRGRVTAGYYAQMGLNELIASNAETYVSLCLKLAHDAAFKNRMQAEIKANSHKLYERMEVVREMETFFLEAHKAWHKGIVLSNDDFRSKLRTT